MVQEQLYSPIDTTTSHLVSFVTRVPSQYPGTRILTGSFYYPFAG